MICHCGVRGYRCEQNTQKIGESGLQWDRGIQRIGPISGTDHLYRFGR
nr:MAG TPA: hypothetical protein [Caudoviricetes sp.]